MRSFACATIMKPSYYAQLHLSGRPLAALPAYPGTASRRLSLNCAIAPRSAWFGVSLVCSSGAFVFGDLECEASHLRSSQSTATLTNAAVYYAVK
jgi:hypothetical protein